jgi:hypothetical protein
MDSDSLDSLPLPKSVSYSQEELEVHRRFIDDDNDKSKPLSDTSGVSGDSWIPDSCKFMRPFLNLKSIALLIILLFVIWSSYFKDFLNTIKYLNEQPMKITITQILLSLIFGFFTQYA